MLCTERCKACTYGGIVMYTTTSCDYMYLTGEPRGCPAGDDCDKFKERKQNGDMECSTENIYWD